MLVFEEKGKPEYLEKNLSKQRREPTTNSTHICVDAGIWTRATLVGGERSHHCAIPCSPKERVGIGLVCNNSNIFVSEFITALLILAFCDDLRISFIDQAISCTYRQYSHSLISNTYVQIQQELWNPNIKKCWGTGKLQWIFIVMGMLYLIWAGPFPFNIKYMQIFASYMYNCITTAGKDHSKYSRWEGTEEKCWTIESFKCLVIIIL